VNDEDDSERNYSSSAANDESEGEEENEESIDSDGKKWHESYEQNEHTPSSSTISNRREPEECIGIIDLRPNPEPDSLIFITVVNKKAHSTTNICATFPPVETTSSESTDDESIMNQQAAASHTIGTLASTVYLVISYDFDNGKTVLHRSFGGLKLMNFMDGLRTRWDDHNKIHEDNHTRVDDLEPRTKLAIILVPSSTSGALSLVSCLPDAKANNDDLDQSSSEDLSMMSKVVVKLKDHTKLNVSGADYLFDRLKSYFAMGGDRYDAIDPFEKVEMLGVWETGQEGSDGHDGKGMKEVVLKHYSQQNSTDDGGFGLPRDTDRSEQNYRKIVKDAFASAGGIGEMIFEK